MLCVYTVVCPSSLSPLSYPICDFTLFRGFRRFLGEWAACVIAEAEWSPRGVQPLLTREGMCQPPAKKAINTFVTSILSPIPVILDISINHLS